MASESISLPQEFLIVSTHILRFLCHRAWETGVWEGCSLSTPFQHLNFISSYLLCGVRHGLGKAADEARALHTCVE